MGETMTIFQSVVLGIIQGLTELLPISSSAHLNLVPWVLGWDITESFDVALHFGTLLAIALFFFKDWLGLVKGGFNQIVKKENSTEGRMFWYIVAATIPGGIIGFVLEHFTENALNTPIVIAIALIVMGILLYIVDKKAPSKVEYENMTFKQTFLIGVSQAMAFIPGVSRSGVTITTARAMGISRESAAKYSFMLSAPIVLGATIFKFKDFIFSIPWLIGVLVSFIVGLVVIKFLLNYLRKGSFKAFAIYRVIVGIFIIALFIIRM